jgi:hypothetical protein
MNTLEWVKECQYISDQTQRVKGGFPGKEFNYATECFRRYCRMQHAQAIKEEAYDSAEYIEQCLNDIEGLS